MIKIIPIAAALVLGLSGAAVAQTIESGSATGVVRDRSAAQTRNPDGAVPNPGARQDQRGSALVEHPDSGGLGTQGH